MKKTIIIVIAPIIIFFAYSSFSIRYAQSQGQLAPTACGAGQVPVWNNVQKIWECGAGGGGGASTADTFITLSGNADLTAERILAAGKSIALTDGGAEGNLTIDLTNASAQYAAADQISAAGAFATTYTIPANTLTANSVVEIWAAGVFVTTATASPVSNFSVKFGGTTVLPALTNNVGLTTNQSTPPSWQLQGKIICVTTGAGGTVDAQGYWQIVTSSVQTGTLAVKAMGNSSTVAIDTTATQQITINETATLVSGQTFNLRQLIVRISK